MADRRSVYGMCAFVMKVFEMNQNAGGITSAYHELLRLNGARSALRMVTTSDRLFGRHCCPHVNFRRFRADALAKCTAVSMAGHQRSTQCLLQGL